MVVLVFTCGPKTVLVKRTFLRWGGVGGVGGACQRSLYFVHYSVLRCKDLWDRCYYAAEISVIVATLLVTMLLLRC